LSASWLNRPRFALSATCSVARTPPRSTLKRLNSESPTSSVECIVRPRLDQMTSRCGGSSSWGVVLGRALDSPGQTAGEEGASSRRGRAGPGGPRSWDLSVWRRRRSQGRRRTRATCCSESWTLSPTNGLSTIADINRRQSTQFITRSVRLYTCRGFEAKPEPKSTTRCDNRRGGPGTSASGGGGGGLDQDDVE